MSRELLQQALDAFESIRRLSSIEDAHIIAKNARYGLREELAKPEQEPVAQILIKNGHWIDTPQSQVNHLPDGLHDLYTAPPRKPWVGLTDDEIHKIIDACTSDEAGQGELNDFARAVRFVEAKLKELNT